VQGGKAKEVRYDFVSPSLDSKEIERQKPLFISYVNDIISPYIKSAQTAPTA
jgi:hypothetical protein